MKGLRKTIETYGLLESNPPPFQNTAMRRATIRAGMRLSLLTETHIGTPVGLKRLFTLDFTLTTSIGIMELKFRKRGSLRSNNTAADRYQGGRPREQFLV